MRVAPEKRGCVHGRQVPRQHVTDDDRLHAVDAVHTDDDISDIASLVRRSVHGLKPGLAPAQRRIPGGIVHAPHRRALAPQRSHTGADVVLAVDETAARRCAYLGHCSRLCFLAVAGRLG